MSDYDDDSVDAIVGTAQTATIEDDDDEPIACIYVPSTGTRSGWGMRMVYRKDDRPRARHRVHAAMTCTLAQVRK